MGDSYLLMARLPGPSPATVELRFQFRYAAAPPARLLRLDARTLWFGAAGVAAPTAGEARKKVEHKDVTQALASLGAQARYNQLRQQVMERTDCCKRTAQVAIADACRGGMIEQADGQYRLQL